MTEPHAHHWVLQTSNAYHVPAKCDCGEEKVFTGGYQSALEAYRQSKGSVFRNNADPQERIVNEVMSMFRQSHWEAM